MRLTAAALLLALPGLAQAQPLGIAIIQAPEQFAGHAMGATPPEAIGRATAECLASGVLAQDCLVTNWCFPAGWTITLAVMHREGLHWSESYCGLPERAIALAQAEALCDLDARPWLTDCTLAAVLDPEGRALADW